MYAAGVVFVFGLVNGGEAAERELEFALRGIVRLRRRGGLRGIGWLGFGSHCVDGLLFLGFSQYLTLFAVRSRAESTDDPDSDYGLHSAARCLMLRADT